jgi:hypothetical protein
VSEILVITAHKMDSITGQVNRRKVTKTYRKRPARRNGVKPTGRQALNDISSNMNVNSEHDTNLNEPNKVKRIAMMQDGAGKTKVGEKKQPAIVKSNSEQASRERVPRTCTESEGKEVQATLI